MKLDFVIPGFSKCGTTTLCALLDHHPQISISNYKEPCYFSHKFHLGEEYYSTFFKHAKENALRGDGSTNYSSEQHAKLTLSRILDYAPDARFIFIARDPFTRLESSYHEMHSSGYKYSIFPEFGIDKALVQLPNMIADTRYWTLFNYFREHVPDRRILVLLLEEFNKTPTQHVQRCLEFLGVDANWSPPNESLKLNPSSTKRYDSRLYRLIQRTPWLQKKWQGMSKERQAWLVKTLDLRPKFKSPVVWPREYREKLERELAQEAIPFLQHIGKPLSHWSWCEKYATTQVRNAA